MTLRISKSRSLSHSTPLSHNYDFETATPTLPSMTSSISVQSLYDYFSTFFNGNQEQYVSTYPAPTAGNLFTGDIYSGCTYDPSHNRIFFIPKKQYTQVNKKGHLIDCASNQIVEFELNAALPANTEFVGGVYSPIDNNIYLIPQDSATTTWYYIDCDNYINVNNAPGGSSPTIITLGTYTGIANVVAQGGVYNPIQNKIYLIPGTGTGATNFYYISPNNSSSTVTLHQTFADTIGSYYGGCYSPAENRIYMAPYGASTNSTWYYIDCNNADGSKVQPITNPGVSIATAFIGLVYCPTNNCIYLVPNGIYQSTSSNWYIDCNPLTPNSSKFVAIQGVTFGTNNGVFRGGVYSPPNNRIYLIPNRYVVNITSMWYIDCNTNTFVAYAPNPVTTDNGYQSGVFCPTNNTIYMAPRAQTTTWAYIQVLGGKPSDMSLMSGALFNKF